MFHLQSLIISVVLSFCLIIQPCQSFMKHVAYSFPSYKTAVDVVLNRVYLLDSRSDAVVKSWTRKDAESTEFPKDLPVRKLLDLLNSRSISPRDAKKSFESILLNWQDFQLSEIGWHRLLDGAIRWRYPAYAISSFEIMTEQGIVCPAYLMTSLLQLVCISGYQDVALSLFDSGVAAGLEPSVHCFSPLLKSCGTAQKARELLQRMEFVGIQANVISYTAAIKSCENTGDWRSALELLDLMRASGVTANEITYCCAINVASRGNAGDIAVNILREMLSLGFPPNLLCYGSALTGCAKVGMWHEVEVLLEEMQAFGIPLQESVMISVLNVCRTLLPLPKTSEPITSLNTYESSDDHSDDPAPSGMNDMRSKVTSCQWARTLWLIQNYGLKATNVTESMYTMGMDVCESGGRYREVIATYHMMISHNVQPSKSSFSFALRACSFLKDGEEAVKVIRAAQVAGAATPFMYNSTLVLLDNMRRNDMALKMLRDILSIGASSDVAVPSNGTTYTSNPEDDSGYHLPSGGSSQPNKMRLPPGWLTRRIISNALQNLTENFSVYFTDVKNGRLSPSKELRPFVSDVAEVLKGTVHDRNLYLSTSAYPMANKILLDCEDFETLQSLLNHTLYKPEVNTTRLYEFALKSLLKDNPTQRSIDVILLLVTDIVKASIPQYASHLILDAMERLQVSKIKIPQQSYDASSSLASLSSKQTIPRGMIPKRGCDANEVLRANLLYQLFEKGKALIPGGLPKRAYVILALACKKANLPLLMLNLYKVSQEDNIDDRMLKNAIVFTLARSSEHWDIAIEILEGMRRENGGVSDLNMYYGAFSACDSGKDWEQAIYLLNRLQEDGHKLSTLSVTSVITVCSACGRAEEALGLLRMMEEKNIVRTVWTYNAAIAACAKTGNWKGALSVFEKMRENSMEVKDSFEGAEDMSNPHFESSLIGVSDSPASRRMSSDVLDVSDSALGMIDKGIEEEEDEEDEEEEQEEEGWNERLNADFDDSFGTGNYREINQNLEGIEEAGLFNGMRGVANQVTYNTLIEALGEGGQQILVDELYKEAVENNIVNPLSGFSKGYIDLHGHSVHMAKAAIRYTFEYMLSSKVDSEIDFTISMEKSRVLKPLVAAAGLPSYSAIPSVDATLKSSDDVMTRSVPTKRRELVVIVGKGDKLVSSIQKLLTDEFHPPIRSHISKSNSGRLLLSDVDISKWLAIHNSVR